MAVCTRIPRILNYRSLIYIHKQVEDLQGSTQHRTGNRHVTASKMYSDTLIKEDERFPPQHTLQGNRKKPKTKREKHSGEGSKAKDQIQLRPKKQSKETNEAKSGRDGQESHPPKPKTHSCVAIGKLEL